MNTKYLPCIIFFLFFFIIYILLPSHNYYWDAISFAQTIEDEQSLSAHLLHPNHLLYNVLGFLLYYAAHLFITTIRAITVLQIANMVFSVITAAVLFRIIAHIVSERYTQFALTALFAFSATWWRFSVDGDAYIIATLLLTVCSYQLLVSDHPKPLIIASCHSAGILFHQMAIVFIPVAIFGIINRLQHNKCTYIIKALSLYLLGVSVIVLGAYIYAFTLVNNGNNSANALWKWVTSHSTDSYFSFNLSSGAIFSLRGLFRLIWGGKISDLTSYSFWIYGPAIIAIVYCFAAFIWKAFAYRGEMRRFLSNLFIINDKYSHVYQCALIWIVCYSAFLFVWLPNNTFYRLLYLPALIILVAVGFGRFQRNEAPPRRWRMMHFVIGSILLNLTFMAIPNSLVANNPPLMFALRMKSIFRNPVVVLYKEFNPDDWFVKYFNPETKWDAIDADSLKRLDAQIREIAGRRQDAWIETSAIKFINDRGKDWQQWIEETAKKEGRYVLDDGRHEIRFYHISTRISP